MTARICGNIPMPVSGRWTVDETYVRTLGGDRYLFGVMDSESRFVTACDMSDTKLDCDATDLFRKAVGAAGKIPRVPVSDRPHGFGRGFKNVMAGGRRGRRERPRPPCHIRSASIRGRHVNNNRRERLNGVIKDRIKTVRGFNSENPALLGLLVTCYNFLRPRAGLDGKTPAEKLGILVRGPDKWATLLACAAAYC
ncbi:MAG: DDE-type integrase/transposase/recombinase [Thaumarchaeota archaeon]|nr:DDE-type integrase/transposase/recombinase [Nitrososphaerota archaeon]